MFLAGLLKCEQKGHLSREESFEMFQEVMQGRIDPVVLAALLTALEMNGVTVDELVGAAQAMRQAAHTFQAPAGAVDLVGTGGDGLGTFNCSTTAAFIAASAGATLAKHGNRASTSKSGSADCLAALGYDLSKPLTSVAHDLTQKGICFCFANLCHPAMKFAAPVRRALPFRTIFNLLGPLTNPAGVRHHALGVWSEKIIPLYVEALRALGAVHALVFCGPDGLDEIGLSGLTHVAELKADGSVHEFDFDPKSLIGSYYPVSSLAGGTPEVNAALTLAVLNGVEKGPYRLAACLNAAAALVAADCVTTLEEGFLRACEAINSGAAHLKLKAFLS